MLHEGCVVVHDDHLLLLQVDRARLGALACLEDHGNVLDEQRDVHELQGLHMHECAVEQQPQGLFELLALLHELGLAVLKRLLGRLDGRLLLLRIVTPPLVVVHHPQAQVHLGLFNEDTNRVLVLLLVPQRALGILVAAERLGNLGVHGHLALKLHQARELLEGVNERDPFHRQDRVLVDVPHALATSLSADLHRLVGLGVLVGILCRCRHPGRSQNASGRPLAMIMA
mmetsp:Transcript_19056/g.43264  ORF Transcript_19056/g.43264 Transcript_19056/m.43264 type:complete len:228 (-) Transcript_19056:3-686(-)